MRKSTTHFLIQLKVIQTWSQADIASKFGWDLLCLKTVIFEDLPNTVSHFPLIVRV